MTAQTTRMRAPAVVGHTPTPDRVFIEWGISRRALGDLAPSGDSKLLTLRYEGSPDASESWTLFDPQSQTRITLNGQIAKLPAQPSIRSSGGHVLVQSPTIYAFVSIEQPEQPALLYARTSVFDRLSISGGRYQPMGARIDFARN
jgi:hypothetical protein